MSNLKKYIVLILLGLFTLTGCYDLEQYPQDSALVDFNSSTKAYEALVGVYESLNSSHAYNGFYTYESCTDLGWSNNGWWASYDKYNLSIGTANTYYGAFSGTWQSWYRVIQRANNVVKELKKSTLDNDVRTQYIAEAAFLRALAYFNLLNCFGGVPIYDDNFEADPSEMLLPRNTVEEVRAFILSDLEDCIANLPKTQKAVGRAAQGVAYALRGKVYLFNKQYEQAKADFLQVVNGGYGYALHPSYAALFRPTGFEDGADDCEEIIFAVEHTGDASIKVGMHTQFLSNRASRGGGINTNVASQELVNMYECIDGKPYNREDFFAGISDEDLLLSTFDETTNLVKDYPPQVDKLKAMYDQRDPRMKATIFLPYTTYRGWASGDKKDCEVIVWAEGYHSNPNYGYVQNAYNQQTYMWRKFVEEYDWGGQITDRAYSPVNWPIIRYADVLLMLAECYNQTGDQQNAVAYINQIRQRAGIALLNSGPSWLVATDQANVFARIKQERAVEFAMEGQRFFDLQRWGELVEKTNGMRETDILGNLVGVTKNIDVKFNLWPIPGSEIDKNRALTQNPGW